MEQIMIELSYDYHTVASLLEIQGASEAEIEAFLIEHQNITGRIKASLIKRS